jgi:hypothetical protein
MEINVRPIRTEDDYDAALAEVDSLMDAVPGTSEGDRLDNPREGDGAGGSDGHGVKRPRLCCLRRSQTYRIFFELALRSFDARSMLAESLRGVVAQQLLRRADREGRALALEILINSGAVSNLIREGKTFQIPSVIQTGRKIGMTLMDQSISDLVEQGAVTWEEGMAHAQDKSAFAARSVG